MRHRICQPRHPSCMGATMGAALIACLTGTVLHAGPEQQPLSALDAQPFAAIGRIAYADAPAPGAAICSGVLVAPDLVLTALHCVVPATTAPDPAAIRFAIGWRDGRAAAILRGAEVIAPEQRWNPVTDLALLRLAEPVPATLARPMTLGPQARPGDMLSIVGWRRDAPDAPVRGDLCRVATVVPEMTGLDCEVVSGNSGAPMMTEDAQGWSVREIAVASTKGRDGRPQAIAADPPADLRAAIAAALTGLPD